MGSWTALLVAYLVGGVTFVPLLVGLVLLHAHYVLPLRGDLDTVPDGHPNSVVQDGDDKDALDQARAKERAGSSGGDSGGSSRKKDASSSSTVVHELDVAAGYFAVCREYTPMGINAKPIERTTPVGIATVASPSPSVYQTMYRSIFDRKPVQGPIENNSMSQRPKKAGNVFYVVLRHGHLMLFDDEEQLEVRHVISLAHYDIGIYSGGDKTPEGELFIKRNALCLTRRAADDGPVTDDSQISKPFYLFSENCSAKEDFYFALLKNQEQTFGGLDKKPPKPKQFDIKDIIALVQRLHSSEENIHSRWINAMLGRIFLSVYRTKDLENFIREKMTKKMERVKKPSYLTNISIRKIDTGEAAPFFHNLKLKEFTVEGECVVEADMRYSGNFHIEVAATAKIDLGARIKAREVNLVLALVLKRIEGHMLFKIKAPPSNRLWLSFQTMPKMEMNIEPIVSSRQITYTVILRQIENRIKEVFAETLVQPFWDDIPFFHTEHKDWRGGIFEGDDAVEKSQDPEAAPVPIPDIDGQAETPAIAAAVTPDPPASPRSVEKCQIIQPLENQAPVAGFFGRKLVGSKSGNTSPAAASLTSLDSKGYAITTSRPLNIIKNNVEPVVGTEAAHADLFKPSTSPADNATSLIAALHSKAQQDTLPLGTLAGTPSKRGRVKTSDSSSIASKEGSFDAAVSENNDMMASTTRRNTVSSSGSHEGIMPPSPSGSHISQTGSIGRKFFMRRENSNISTSTTSTTGDVAASAPKRNNTLAAVTNVANQARQWGWNALQRQKDARRNSEVSNHVDLSQPMGRGQPLPPPGMPLPGPTTGKTKIVPISVPKRKPNPLVAFSEHSSTEGDGSMEKSASVEQTQPKDDQQLPREDDIDKDSLKSPLPQRRRRGANYQTIEEEEGHDAENVLVISAPADDSQPPSPTFSETGGEDLKLSDDEKDEAKPKGITRKLVSVPTCATDETDSQQREDTTPVQSTATVFPSMEKQQQDVDVPTESLVNTELDGVQGEKPLVALPVFSTLPGPTVGVDDEDEQDGGFSRWIDEPPGEESSGSRAEDVLPARLTTPV